MVAMMQRRAFLGGTMGAATLAAGSAQSVTAAMAESPIDHAPPEPLVWPALVKLPSGIRLFAGHTDTVLDVVGRIGAPPSLVIFTEGNHLMVLLSDDIISAFPSWAKSQSQYADLNLDNIVVSTLPQPILVEAIRAGGIALGNLTLEVSRRSGFYPDIFMGYPEPLRQLHERGVVESQARFFCRNRGVTLLVRKGNPLGIRGLSDVLHAGTRIALPDGCPQLCGRGLYLASPRFVLGADIPEPLRGGGRCRRRAVFYGDRLGSCRRSAACARAPGV